MKKVLLTAMAILTVASASVFGMYGANSDWIDFLVHGNQLRVRMDRLGFVLGNDTIRGTFGFRQEGQFGQSFGSIFTKTGDEWAGVPTISGGLGYTSDMFSIGVGYNFTYINNRIMNLGGTGDNPLMVHTPVVTFTALNDSLRVAIPIEVAVSDLGDNNKDTSYTGVSTDIQIRYYTGIDAFNLIRFHLYYGQNDYKFGTGDANKYSAQIKIIFLKNTSRKCNYQSIC